MLVALLRSLVSLFGQAKPDPHGIVVRARHPCRVCLDDFESPVEDVIHGATPVTAAPVSRQPRRLKAQPLEDQGQDVMTPLAPVVEVARQDHRTGVRDHHLGQGLQLGPEARRAEREIDAVEVGNPQLLARFAQGKARQQRGFGVPMRGSASRLRQALAAGDLPAVSTPVSAPL